MCFNVRSQKSAVRNYLVYGNFLVKRVLDGFDKIGTVTRKVLQLHDATLALDEVDDGLGDASLIEAIFTLFSDFTERLPQVGKLQELSWQGRFPIQQHLIPVWRGTLDLLVRVLVPGAVDLGHRETDDNGHACK